MNQNENGKTPESPTRKSPQRFSQAKAMQLYAWAQNNYAELKRGRYANDEAANLASRDLGFDVTTEHIRRFRTECKFENVNDWPQGPAEPREARTNDLQFLAGRLVDVYRYLEKEPGEALLALANNPPTSSSYRARTLARTIIELEREVGISPAKRVIEMADNRTQATLERYFEPGGHYQK